MPREHVDPDIFLARLTACFPSSSTSAPAPASTPASRSRGKKAAAAATTTVSSETKAPLPQDDEKIERKGGSVWLTHKRFTHDRSSTAATGGDVDMNATSSSSSSSAISGDWDVLIRCTDGVDVNFSTRVPASRLPSFHTTYGTLLKSCFAPHMRKRDKKKDKLKLERREARRRELEKDVDLGRLDKRKRAMERAKRREGQGGEPGAVKALERIKKGEKDEDGKAKIRRVGHRQRKRILAAQYKKETQRAKLQDREQQQGGKKA